MATHVSAGEPGEYREARWMEDVGFCAVPVGPPSTDAVARQCSREGCYTDDTLATLALAASLVEHGRIDAAAAAHSYGDFFRSASPFRGCPPTAAKVMQLVHEGVSVEKTGLPPHFPFAGGSFANGGDLGVFGPGEMQKQFEDGTKSTPIGTMSGIVLSDSGYHLIFRTQ